MQSKIKKLKIKKSNINKLIAISSALLCCNIEYTVTNDCLASSCNNAKPITTGLKTDPVIVKSETNKSTANSNKTTCKSEWTDYKDLNSYYIEEFQKISNQYFGGQSYEDFTKKRTLDSLPEKERKVLDEASKKVYLTSQIQKIDKQIISIKQFLKKMEETPAYNVLTNFITINASKLKKGETVNFSSVLQEICNQVQDSSLRDDLKMIPLQRSLIYSAISKITGIQYSLTVDKKTGRKIEELVNNNNVKYIYTSAGIVYLDDGKNNLFEN